MTRQRRVTCLANPQHRDIAGCRTRNIVASNNFHLLSKMPDGVSDVLTEIKYPLNPKRKPFWSGSRGMTIWDSEDNMMGRRKRGEKKKRKGKNSEEKMGS